MEERSKAGDNTNYLSLNEILKTAAKDNNANALLKSKKEDPHDHNHEDDWRKLKPDEFIFLENI